MAPTTTSIEDALENETACPPAELSCPLGTYSFDYAKDTTMDAAAAYPMPDVTYALVPTAPQAPAQAQAMKNLLTNLVDVSEGDGAAPLPPGYYPMPTTMYQAALTDINTDITAAPSAVTTTTTTSPGPSATSPGSTQPTSQQTPASSSSPGSSGSTGFGQSSNGDLTLPLSSTSTSDSSSKPSSGGTGGSPSGSAGDRRD